jgi:tRNA-guanine family transglycosylase
VSEELLVYRLLSLHNLHFFLGLMTALREAIAQGRFGPFRTRFFERYPVSSVVGPGADPGASDVREGA